MYDDILDQMFSKYPKLGIPMDNMPIGDMKEIWRHRLQYKFRNNRAVTDREVPEVKAKKRKTANKGKKPAKTTPQVKAPPQWGMACYLPRRPITEDDESINRHETFMQGERKKRQPDYKQVKVSMEKTLGDRRAWLVTTTPRPKISEVKDRYPWLFDEDQLSEEMMRLMGGSTTLTTSLITGLNKYAQACIVLGKRKRKEHALFKAACTQISTHRGEQERKEASRKAAFLTLPGLLQENVGDIFVSSEDTDEVSSPVHLKVDGNVLEAESFTLMADGAVIASTESFIMAISMWVSAFYVFNLEYPNCLKKTLAFLQKVVLQIQDDLPAIRPIITLTNKLSIENAQLSK